MQAAVFVLFVATAHAEPSLDDNSRRDDTMRDWLHYAAPAALIGVAGAIFWFVTTRDKKH